MSQDRSRKRALSAALARRLRGIYTGGKARVVDRLAEKIVEAVLENRLTSWDPLHLNALRLTDDLTQIDDRRLRWMVNRAGAAILQGTVVPVQQVDTLLDESDAWYLSKCVCRQAGRVDDRGLACGQPPMTDRFSERERAAAFEDVLRAWRQAPAVERSEAVGGWIAAAKQAADRDGPRAGIDAYWQASYPYLELLLGHPEFTPTWRSSLQKNRKVQRVPREYAHAWARLAYVTREVVFTRMAAVQVDYALCSCPGPEVDSGCILVNWFFGCDVAEALLPNASAAHGQRTDAAGTPLPCRYHPERTVCLGCGCKHEGGG